MTTNNRTKEPTEVQVEVAWQSLLETATDVTTRADVRSALEVALAVAPQPVPVDEEKLAEVIGLGVTNTFGAARFEWEEFTEADRALYRRVAHSVVDLVAR